MFSKQLEHSSKISYKMMKVVTLFLLYFSSYSGLSFCSDRVPNTDVRIAGGSPADIKDFPYMLSLHRTGKGYFFYWCGASILSPSWAVTAAHCVYGLYRKEKHFSTSWAVTAAHCAYGNTIQELSLQSGSSYKFSGGQFHDIQQITIHPNYNQKTLDYDIALLKVSKPFQFSEVVKSIRMARQGPSVGTNAIISGWGELVEGGAQPSQLQKAGVSIIDKQHCLPFFTNTGPTLTDRMFCASSANYDKGPCHGDSGSSLVANGELIGVFTWFATCGYGPSVYVNVVVMRPWITSITGVN